MACLLTVGGCDFATPPEIVAPEPEAPTGIDHYFGITTDDSGKIVRLEQVVGNTPYFQFVENGNNTRVHARGVAQYLASRDPGFKVTLDRIRELPEYRAWVSGDGDEAAVKAAIREIVESVRQEESAR